MSRPPDLPSLQLLVLVADRESLTAAAEEAGMSQPAASKRMTALERRLGVRLLDRSRRGSTLTAAGELVTGWARRVLDELNVLVEGVEVLRQESEAHLRIAASLTVAEHLLPAWLGELRRAEPDLRVGLQVMNSTRVCDLVRDRAVELGFIESPGPLRGLRSREVGRDRLVLAVAPTHPWARRRRPIDVAQLAGTPLISREAGSGTRETVELAVAAHGERLVRPLLELGSSAAIRSAALAGAGPALLSELVVAPDVATRALVEVPIAGIDLSRRLRAVWHAGTSPAGSAAALIGHALVSRAGRGRARGPAR
ncbi:LysR family transcriptional regulator [Pseudonocardia kunmingensis]|uniref:DNA-binding transcriptional LysR family regulator n=1 Tax=Pseudonocardia kunmingensis TaxID=630975 RepID=A0A543DIY4_9PSEU|nr:LysR family transcriptional regulator [Pseudonocardia kunmingensis]TQM09271.1 DNA-binding transcriptional LysR family regulator [Pseudonocardia kunmingensis]